MKWLLSLVALVIAVLVSGCESAKAGGFGFSRQQVVVQNAGHCGAGQQVIVQNRGFNNQRFIVQNNGFRQQKVFVQRQVFVPQSFGFQQRQNFVINIDD